MGTCVRFLVTRVAGGRQARWPAAEMPAEPPSQRTLELRPATSCFQTAKASVKLAEPCPEFQLRAGPDPLFRVSGSPFCHHHRKITKRQLSDIPGDSEMASNWSQVQVSNRCSRGAGAVSSGGRHAEGAVSTARPRPASLDMTCNETVRHPPGRARFACSVPKWGCPTRHWTVAMSYGVTTAPKLPAGNYRDRVPGTPGWSIQTAEQPGYGDPPVPAGAAEQKASGALGRPEAFLFPALGVYASPGVRARRRSGQSFQTPRSSLRKNVRFLAGSV